MYKKNSKIRKNSEINSEIGDLNITNTEGFTHTVKHKF
jgi:hypothetical protein